MRAVVVEDDALQQALVEGVLQRRGHAVASYGTAEEAWADLQRELCDLLLLDWQLPGMDGLELCRRVRALPGGETPEVLVITGMERREGLPAAVEAGANDFLAKPFIVSELNLRLAVAERHRAAVAALEQARREAEALAAEKAVLAAERTAIIEQMPNGVVVLDAAGRVTFMNPAGRRISGRPPDPDRALAAQAAEYHLREPGTGRPLAPEETPAARAIAGETVTDYEVLFRPGDPESGEPAPGGPEERWIATSATPLRGESAEVQGAVAVFSDVTEERLLVQRLAASEEQLRVSEERFRLIAEHARDLISLVSAEGAFLYASPSYEVVLGYEHAALLAMRATDLVRPDDREKAVDGSSTVPVPYRIRRADGSWLWVEGSSYGVTWQGQPCLVAIARDITARRRAEERTLQQVERLSGLRSIEMAITSSFDLRVTLSIVLDQLTAQLGVDAAAVLLLDPVLQQLEYRAARGLRGSGHGGEVLRLSAVLAGRPVLERSLVTVANLADEPLLMRRWLVEEGFVAYIAQPLIAKGEMKGVLEVFHRAPLSPDHEWIDYLDSLAQQTAVALDNALLFEGLQRSNLELALAYDATIEGWSRALDLRDKETEGHSQRVTEMTLRLAQRAGMTRDELLQVRRGALLHDIGKMGIPDAILLKPGPLTEEEWTIMRLHPQYAFELLLPIAHLRPALDIPYRHHEKWDGTGYPRGLAGEQIPLAARLFAVVDVWDALSADRPYRPAWPAERIHAYLRAQAGRHFAPAAVEAFLELIKG
jgi:PAS domain S-box-containing protein